MAVNAPAPSPRQLTVDDLPGASELLGDGLVEMPVYEWILGEHVEDRGVRTALARVILRPMIAAGYVVGVDGASGLLGLLVWYQKSAGGSVGEAGPGSAVDPDDVAFLTSHPDLARRLLEFWNGPALPSPEPDAVSMPLATVSSDARGSGVIRALVRTVEEFCIANDTRFYVWTGRERLRDLYVNGWGVEQFAVREFDENTTLYGLASDRPPPLTGD